MIQYDDLVRWSDLTPDQQDSIGNGCGPGFLPEFITRLLFGWFHNTSCNRHDFGYRRGGTGQHRKIVDEGFKTAMRVDANRLSGIKRLIAKIQAPVYYRIVRWFGWLSFYYGSPRSISEILK